MMSGFSLTLAGIVTHTCANHVWSIVVPAHDPPAHDRPLRAFREPASQEEGYDACCQLYKFVPYSLSYRKLIYVIISTTGFKPG